MLLRHPFRADATRLRVVRALLAVALLLTAPGCFLLIADYAFVLDAAVASDAGHSDAQAGDAAARDGAVGDGANEDGAGGG